ncbi:MAG: hypothetical protein J6T39_01680 [Clostridia bacterium]|nr:hypothetical protein [Clostridia bacterium]
MMNLLNAISALYIGIISLAVIVIILVLFFILNFKRGIARTGLKIVVFLISLAVAIFVSKPLLSLFDGLFSFSTVFFQFFMTKFAGINGLNERVVATNYVETVNNFKTSDVGISATLKNLLVDVFENSSVPSDRATTLSAVASTTFSYLCALFVVALVLFFVVYGLLSLIINLITRHFGGNHERRNLKVLSGIIGFFEGIIVSVIMIVSLSTLPFFGISTDFLASGFETTYVMNTPYQFILKTERTVYKSIFDYNAINMNASQNLNDIVTGTYNNFDNTEAKWQVIIVIQTKTATASSVSVGLTNNETHEAATEECNYIYVNDSLYLFKDKKLMAICKFDKKEKVLTYTKTTETQTIKEKVKFVSASIA